MSTPASPRRRNRRGSGDDLRTEIIAATKKLLADSGSSEAVSIRAVATAVGVTSPSIYLHFADKDALIAAVVVDVFAELDEVMMRAAKDEPTPLERLRACGLAYVRFAVEHPEHYRVATMERCVDAPGGPQAQLDEMLAQGAFTHFMDTVRECMTVGTFAAGDPLPVTLRLWSSAHGIASLMIAKPYLPWGELEQTANAALRAAAVGQAVSDLLGGEPDPATLLEWLAAQQK